MQPLIHKTSVRLTVEKIPRSACLGDSVQLSLKGDGKITVVYAHQSGFILNFGKIREITLGYLGRQASHIVRPALERSAHLRARIVQIEPAHLSRTKQENLFLSVWGDPDFIFAQRTPHLVFSRSRINDFSNSQDDG